MIARRDEIAGFILKLSVGCALQVVCIELYVERSKCLLCSASRLSVWSDKL